MVKNPEISYRRVSDYTTVAGYNDENAEERQITDLYGLEILILDWETREFNGAEGLVRGAAFLAEDLNTGQIIKALTFSGVLVDQLGHMSPDRLPALARIEQRGDGTRKYQTFV